MNKQTLQLATGLCLVMFLLLNTSCNSTQKAISHGNYDYSINKSVEKLRKSNKKDKYILSLEEAYNKANERDLNRIVFLKKEGNPANWHQIYDLYNTLNRRQNKVRPVTPLFIVEQNRRAEIHFDDYSDDIIAAKTKTAEYYYAKGEQLLASNDKHNARQAYEQFIMVKGFMGTFRDVDARIQQARHLGTNNVLVHVRTDAGMLLPTEFRRELESISLNGLNREWLNYTRTPQTGIDYDYDVVINLTMIDVSPESIKEKHFREQKDIVDGKVNLRDEEGNFIVDSLGNKIQVDNHVTVYCDVIEVQQHKAARVSGTVDYFDKRTKERLDSNPITSDAFFDYSYAVVSGNANAMSKRVKRLACLQPAPFPNDFELLMQASETLKGAVKDVLNDHRRLVLK